MMVVFGVSPLDRVGLREEDLVRLQRDELEIEPLPMVAVMVGRRAKEAWPWKFQRAKAIAWVQSELSPGFNSNRGVALPSVQSKSSLVFNLNHGVASLLLLQVCCLSLFLFLLLALGYCKSSCEREREKDNLRWRSHHYDGGGWGFVERSSWLERKGFGSGSER